MKRSAAFQNVPSKASLVLVGQLSGPVVSKSDPLSARACCGGAFDVLALLLCRTTVHTFVGAIQVVFQSNTHTVITPLQPWTE